MGTDAGQLGLDFGSDVELRRLLRVTPAKLAGWDGCPRRYRMTYLDRPAASRGGAWAHHTLGAVVHLALRSFLALPAARRTPAAAAAQVDRHWSAEGFRDARQGAGYRSLARDWLARYAAEHDFTAPGSDPVGIERWVSAAVDGLVVEGRVDRIDDRDGRLVVVDYKTGRRPVGADDARRSRALALYAVAVGRELRRPCTRVELHHLPSGRIGAFEHDAASLQAHVDDAARTAAEADAAAAALAAGGDPESLFPPRTSPACATCELRRQCPEGRAAVPAPQPWELLAPLDPAAVP